MDVIIVYFEFLQRLELVWLQSKHRHLPQNARAYGLSLLPALEELFDGITADLHFHTLFDDPINHHLDGSFGLLHLGLPRPHDLLVLFRVFTDYCCFLVDFSRASELSKSLQDSHDVDLRLQYRLIGLFSEDLVSQLSQPLAGFQIPLVQLFCVLVKLIDLLDGNLFARLNRLLLLAFNVLHERV